jgi:hypothetical protein
MEQKSHFCWSRLLHPKHSSCSGGSDSSSSSSRSAVEHCLILAIFLVLLSQISKTDPIPVEQRNFTGNMIILDLLIIWHICLFLK